MLFLNHAKKTFEVTEAQTSGLVNLVLSRKTVFFECEHPFIDKPMAITEPDVASTAIRPGFETTSQEHAAYAQQKSYSIHTESFSSTTKSSKRKKGSVGRLELWKLCNNVNCP